MQTDILTIGCIVLAAGNAVRFGGDKLSVQLGGKSLLERALCAVPTEEFAAVVVITQAANAQTGSTHRAIVHQAIAHQAVVRRYGFTALENPHPERGISESVKLGTAALMESCDALLFQTADQPLLRRETVRKLASLWRENPGKIVALAHNGVRGNPCIFPARFYPELLALHGDRGGSAVIRRHTQDLVLLEAPEAELLDADTRSALAELARRLE